jgi:hypothetical protein
MSLFRNWKDASTFTTPTMLDNMKGHTSSPGGSPFRFLLSNPSRPLVIVKLKCGGFPPLMVEGPERVGGPSAAHLFGMTRLRKIFQEPSGSSRHVVRYLSTIFRPSGKLASA